ncbi:hypothetical protein Pcinc_005702 [Petrolisthes cinctipes]|uniref:Ionotropic glutamate receptor L-glutamate and glycine-binding domain-containing protein n=1 Tax=Petrolisthes cinctipes TaxID=88211 RepID=A0AAE1L2A1_PETCI|nr:hypothetical protein Pcinc_005702 [Petrolisthes cinctipes]
MAHTLMVGERAGGQKVPENMTGMEKKRKVEEYRFIHSSGDSNGHTPNHTTKAREKLAMARSTLVIIGTVVTVLTSTLAHHTHEVYESTPLLSGPPSRPSLNNPSSASLKQVQSLPFTTTSLTLEQTRPPFSLEYAHSSLKTPFLINLEQAQPSLYKPSSMSLEQAVVEVVQGPLREKWIVLMMDSSADQLFSLHFVLDALHKNDHPSPLLLVRPEKETKWHDQFQSSPSMFYSGRCVLILIIGSCVDWLEEESWTPPDYLIVVNVNTSWDATLLIELPLIQRSTSLVLLQGTHMNGILLPHLFTSRYFSKTPHGERLTIDPLGLWDKTRFKTHYEMFPDRFQTLSGEVLHVASDLDDYPLVYSDDDSVDGTNIRILESLGAWLNFTFTLTETAEDNNWGELENGTSWNGLLGEVYRGHKNITVNYFTVVEERLRDFDVTATYFYEGFGFALRVPQPLPAWMSLTYPFKPLLPEDLFGTKTNIDEAEKKLIHVK